MKKLIKLNNEFFEVKESNGVLHPITSYRDLADCYKKASVTKWEIFGKWVKWLSECCDKRVWLGGFNVKSYNTMMFTLECNVYDRKTNKFIGKLYISKTRQEFWVA